MQTTLAFTIPEEQAELRLALNGPAYHDTLWELEGWLRTKLKYECLGEEEARILTMVRDELYTLLGNHDVRLTP